tara:strand:+ start:4413 stop:4895 length:483 start_codon:yes stop_codon:yes gene_type:complete
MVQNRNVRSKETQEKTREKESRVETSWKPPSLLDAPPARDGMVQRWVATSILGKETPDNVFKRKRAGWEPRSSNSVGDFPIPTISHGQWNGCIGIEGMILCEMPEEKFKQMKDYMHGKSEEQNESISNELRTVERSGGIPIHEDRKSSSSRGRDLSVMDD